VKTKFYQDFREIAGSCINFNESPVKVSAQLRLEGSFCRTKPNFKKVRSENSQQSFSHRKQLPFASSKLG
jgi:hypothetical protein